MKELTLDSFDTVFYALAFIVPGFITYMTIASFVPQKEDTGSVILLRFLSLSCFNYALWSWAIYFLFQSKEIHSDIQKGLIYAGLVLVAPIVNGILLVILSKAQIVRRLLGKVGFNPINEIPTGWDFKFSRMKEPEWIIIKLKAGKKVAGYFGSNSFASSGATKDIYLEEAWNPQESGPWKKTERTAGILVLGDSIERIEFFKKETTDVKTQ
ncbi:MAG: DUF6338 family protein [Terriglobales bacterium]